MIQLFNEFTVQFNQRLKVNIFPCCVNVLDITRMCPILSQKKFMVRNMIGKLESVINVCCKNNKS